MESELRQTEKTSRYIDKFVNNDLLANVLANPDQPDDHGDENHAHALQTFEEVAQWFACLAHVAEHDASANTESNITLANK